MVVLGTDTAAPSQTAATLAGDVSAHVYAPNGSLWVGTTGATASGQFLAKRIRAVAGTYNLAVDTGGDDTQAPIVTLDTPDGDDTLTGSVVMTATATDDTAVARVEFEVDNVVVGIATAPNQPGMFEATWDSSGHPNGLTVVRAIAYDTSDNSGTSESVVAVSFNGSVSSVATAFEFRAPVTLSDLESELMTSGLEPVAMVHEAAASVGGFSRGGINVLVRSSHYIVRCSRTATSSVSRRSPQLQCVERSHQVPWVC